MSDKIIVALDGMTRNQALELATALKGRVWGYKVNDLLVQCGLEIVSELKKLGRVFADPKLYDIPATVANSVRVIAGAGADLITVHASGGRDMLRAAVKEAGAAKILSVTVLTSMDDACAKEIFSKDTAAAVAHLGALAQDSGVHGVVCSPKELDLFGKYPSLLKVTPGVRPQWYGKADDQVRTMSPKEAVAQGATHLVIGRPITGHKDALEAVRLIEQELSA